MGRAARCGAGRWSTTAGVPGEPRVAGPTIMSGHWGGVGEPFDEQGCQCLFAIAESGGSLLRHVDRLGGIIIRGGATISPTIRAPTSCWVSAWQRSWRPPSRRRLRISRSWWNG